MALGTDQTTMAGRERGLFCLVLNIATCTVLSICCPTLKRTRLYLPL
jgi:hypothetical protein